MIILTIHSSYTPLLTAPDINVSVSGDMNTALNTGVDWNCVPSYTVYIRQQSTKELLLQDADENASNVALLPHIHLTTSGGVREDTGSIFYSSLIGTKRRRR